jgi:hypothetical protein
MRLIEAGNTILIDIERHSLIHSLSSSLSGPISAICEMLGSSDFS